MTHQPMQPTEFATCPCGSIVFTVLQHRIMCPECGSAVSVPEVNLLKLMQEADTDDSAPFPAHN